MEKAKNLRPAKSKLPEVRCFQCNRLLFCGIAEDMEIKCSRCGAIQYIGNSKQESRVNISSW
ncbi:Com family DNA-binding transcriptional regulator [Sporomusa sp.]|jgi:phage FluMu protein Com|uniref:Com family DNA-binding transcriptional regulator n=1 Tax=Sporomusa sp. TaxID=2078658 RepID=UPI002D0A6942|nr:Com family DNA-binding transcriptional regulator [Sporomusa sp.]MDF2874358.1 hypothetical protein [Sporomusa sp.]HWR06225.1 Com family DNA-binding transcriptional regulator [Sporomusa sp.]